MHVLYVCHEYPPIAAGGIGAAVSVLARGMVKRGHRVTVLGFYDGETRSENDEGVIVQRLRRSRTHRSFHWLVSRWQLREALCNLNAQNPIDVIEWPDWDGMYLFGIPGVTDVLKLHGGRVSHRVHGFGPKMPIREFFEIRMMRRLRNWIGVSRWFNNEWKAFVGALPVRESIVYNPVDVSVFRPAPSTDPNLIFYSGGLRTRKGVQTLAKAARLFLRDLPGTRLAMATFECEMKKVEVLSLAGDMAGRIKFLPFMSQKELAPFMAQASVFVMPSLYESCGNGWIEAMACGVPVVGSLASCGPEVVLDGETGLLCNPESPEDVAEKVKTILADKALGKRMGEAGRRHATGQFSVEVATEISERFYAFCCQERPLTRARN